MRKGEEIEATDVSGGGNANRAMVAGQERQRGLRERERERLKMKKELRQWCDPCRLPDKERRMLVLWWWR